MDNPSTAAIKGPLVVDTSYVLGKGRIFTEFLDDCDLIMTIFHSKVKVKSTSCKKSSYKKTHFFGGWSRLKPIRYMQIDLQF